MLLQSVELLVGYIPVRTRTFVAVQAFAVEVPFRSWDNKGQTLSQPCEMPGIGLDDLSVLDSIKFKWVA